MTWLLRRGVAVEFSPRGTTERWMVTTEALRFRNADHPLACRVVFAREGPTRVVRRTLWHGEGDLEAQLTELFVRSAPGD